MAEKRKDAKGRNLKDGERQRSDGRYSYRYIGKDGTRKEIYSWKLVSTDKLPDGKRDCKPLRELEKEIERDLQDGLDVFNASSMTLNKLFEKYIAIKTDLKEQTKNNTIYRYNLYIRDRYGKKLVKDFKYSDIKAFYLSLLNDGLGIGSVHTVNCVLSPLFTLAVKDDIIKKNPCSGVHAELKKQVEKPEPRHALTKKEQETFLNYLKESNVFCDMIPLFTFFLGTGCRAGEVIGITWKDIDFENNTISINHNTHYAKNPTTKKYDFYIDTPKTDAGKRTIPMLADVRKALFQLKKDQLRYGITCKQKIDGYTDFVFLNSNGKIDSYYVIDQRLKRITKNINKQELEKAKKENAEPFQIRNFTLHNLRHTFCTRLCEVENNVKLIMEIMGHADISTTMNIYNEVQEDMKQESFKTLSDKIRIS